VQLLEALLKSLLIRSPDASTHFPPDESRLKGLTFTETPPSAISRFNCDLEPAAELLIRKSLASMTVLSSAQN